MKTIESFLGMYPKRNTVKSYKASVLSYLDFIYGRVRSREGGCLTKQEREQYEELNQQYFKDGRDYVDDLIMYIASMNSKPPNSIKTRIAAAKEWMGYNGVEFTQRELKVIKNKLPTAKRGWTDEKDLDKEILKKILSHTDEKGRALILTLASSGMRIGEGLQIKLDDLDLSNDLPEINVKGAYTKGGERRTVFISKEAKEAVEEWLSVRDDYLKSSKNRGLGLGVSKKVKDDRIFPFTDSVARQMWSNALKKAGFHEKDNGTGRLKYRIHGLRKFFRSQLALTCPVDIVEALMGYERYLTDAYRRYTTKQMGEYYLKAEHHITIFESGDLAEIRGKLQDTSATVEGYKSIVTGQAEEMAELKKDLENMKKRFDEREEIQKITDNVLTLLIEDDEMIEKLKNRMGV